MWYVLIGFGKQPEGGVLILDISGGEDMERYRSSTFDLNMQILVTTEITSELLRFVCWRFTDLQLLCIAKRWLWTRKRIKSRNSFRDSKKFASNYSWWWIKSPHGEAFDQESSWLWVVAWLWTPWWEMSSKGSMVLEQWLSAAIRFRRGWDSGIEFWELSHVPTTWHVAWSWQGQILTTTHIHLPREA